MLAETGASCAGDFAHQSSTQSGSGCGGCGCCGDNGGDGDGDGDGGGDGGGGGGGGGGDLHAPKRRRAAADKLSTRLGKLAACSEADRLNGGLLGEFTVPPLPPALSPLSRRADLQDYPPAKRQRN